MGRRQKKHLKRIKFKIVKKIKYNFDVETVNLSKFVNEVIEIQNVLHRNSLHQ